MASQAPAEKLLDNAVPFAPLQILISRIDSESHVQEVINKARDLDADGRQLLIDTLSMVLNRSKALSQRHAYVWKSLVKIASSARTFARNRTLKLEDSKTLARVKIMKQNKDNDLLAIWNERLVEWAHLSHPNILPLFAAFLEGEKLPCLRVPLILDVVDGLCYLHQLNIVHGGLSPEAVVISDYGRALITELDTSFEEQGSNLPTRYSPPELLTQDDSHPTKATDVWSMACLGHEVLSGKAPFCQVSNNDKAVARIVTGDKPARPGQDGRGGSEIGDAMWNLLLTCWAYEVKDRPNTLKLQETLSRMQSEQRLSEHQPAFELEVLKTSMDLDPAQTILTRVLASHQPSSVQVPKHLRAILSRLVRDSEALEKATTAAKKLTRDDAQTLVDFVELVVKDLPYLPESNLIGGLLCDVMGSMFNFPQYYRANDVRHDPDAFVSENDDGRTFGVRGLRIRVYVAESTGSWINTHITKRLPLWANTSHPNLLPFHGVFHDDLTGSPRLCVVLPYLKNGTLEDYAPTLPQKSRMLLISDVIDGLAYLQNILDFDVQDHLTGQGVVISDEGRALITAFGAQFTYLKNKAFSSWFGYRYRFRPRGSLQQNGQNLVIWSFGCLSYQVLSRKLPYYEYSDDEVYGGENKNESLRRPEHTDAEIDEIDDLAWNLITKCCASNPDDQPNCSQIREILAGMEIEEDHRPSATPLPLPEIQALRSRPEVDLRRAEIVLSKSETLKEPLSKLIRNHTKEVAAAVAQLKPDDIQTVVDFLDQALKDILTITEERNRVLAILSRITSSTLIFPQCFESKRIKCGPRLDEGGCGIVYKGADDPTVCIKLMKKRLDTGALMPWIKEVILWAHSSHPNVLPFLGVFLEGENSSPQPCLVSPFMQNGNMKDYAARLPQNSRLPLMLDVINGLQYLHGLGIVHGDLKGQNVLISVQGRGLITDFGTSHINTATAFSGKLSTTTLCFTAPEAISGNKKATREFDIWSLGCLFYEVQLLPFLSWVSSQFESFQTLSRKPPYYQYSSDIQIFAALSRKERPKRPGSTDDDDEERDEYDWDDDLKQNYDAIDDQAWDLIVECCAPKPEDRPGIARIRELVVDLKIHDDRPAPKDVPGAEIMKSRVESKIDLNRVEELFDQIREKIQAHTKADSRDA
ncbi:hypothetical protein AN958_04070 [Leucoagaricus sp. SymC.cos]|nr:hypothetical protein AN958_04070 [Leucoagaricus sp. SymC.cos]